MEERKKKEQLVRCARAFTPIISHAHMNANSTTECKSFLCLVQSWKKEKERLEGKLEMANKQISYTEVNARTTQTVLKQ